MKRKLVLLSLSILLFTSCLVKSIQPFYVKNAIKFNKDLVGNWTDNKKGTWEVESFKTKWKEDSKDIKIISEDDKKEYERYKNSYIFKNVRTKNEATFIAMPFMVDDHLFLDFFPLDHEAEDLNELAAFHLLQTHSTAYVKINNDSTITLKWLSEKAIKYLVNSQKLRMKHEKTGLTEDIEDLVLTATSNELYEFLKKFMKHDFEEKWDKEDIYTLTLKNAKP